MLRSSNCVLAGKSEAELAKLQASTSCHCVAGIEFSWSVDPNPEPGRQKNGSQNKKIYEGLWGEKSIPAIE
jgi:hypothetical protein